MKKMTKSGKLDAGSTGALKIGAKKGDDKPPSKKDPVDKGERAKGKSPMARRK